VVTQGCLQIGRVGIWHPARTWHVAGDQLPEAASELEELGYGALWLGDSRGDLELPRRVLSATERLVVATAIISVWTNPADEVAAAYAGLADAYSDRLLIGLGASHAPAVERAGFRYERPVRRLREYLDELDRIDQTVPKKRRVLAALGPRALVLAARRSAGAHSYLVTPEHTSWAREQIGPGPLLAPEQKAVLETDPDAARMIARGTLQLYLQLPNYTRNLLRLGFSPEDLEGSGSDRLVDALFAWGDADAIHRRIAEHHQAGADHVSLQVLTSPDRTSGGLPREQWRRLAKALQPASAG
jgi:probable F420-dependent oxidoreductase